MSIPRHFGQVRGQEVVIAGYNKSQNNCLVVFLNNLPQDEAAELRRIALSTTAQNLDYLVPTLRVERHKSNADWFSHIAERLRRSDGAALVISIKEIEKMNDAQKAFFKGYGTSIEPKGGPSNRVGKDEEFNTSLPYADSDPDEAIVASEYSEEPPRPIANISDAEAAGVVQSRTPKNDPDMARAAAQAAGPDPLSQVAGALATLAESQAQMAATLDRIEKGQKKAPVRKKRATKKKVAAAPAEAAEA